jgi:PAS domain S-box-containing protein
VTFLNPVAESLTGWPLSKARGRNIAEVFPAELPSTPKTGAPPVQAPAHVTVQDGEGGRRTVEYTAAPMRNDAGDVIGRVLVFRDVTQRRQAEEELRLSREQLRALAAHMERVREEERTRIAREVHDELGQMITGLRMDVSWIERRLPGVADGGVRAAFEKKVGTMYDLLDHLVKAVRKISAELRPGALDDLGLVPAMEWQAREWQARTGIACDVTSKLDSTAISPAHATALFRIFQETLTNVARHAQATKVRAELNASAGAVTLLIEDNGRGITEAEQRQTKSFGLLGMRERAELLGGTCRISGRPGEGTQVQIQVPFTSMEGAGETSSKKAA